MSIPPLLGNVGLIKVGSEFVRAPKVPFWALEMGIFGKSAQFLVQKIVLLVPKLKNEDHIYKPNIPQKCWIRHLLSEIIIFKQDFYNFIF